MGTVTGSVPPACGVRRSVPAPVAGPAGDARQIVEAREALERDEGWRIDAPLREVVAFQVLAVLVRGQHVEAHRCVRSEVKPPALEGGGHGSQGRAAPAHGRASSLAGRLTESMKRPLMPDALVTSIATSPSRAARATMVWRLSCLVRSRASAGSARKDTGVLART